MEKDNSNSATKLIPTIPKLNLNLSNIFKPQADKNITDKSKKERGIPKPSRTNGKMESYLENYFQQSNEGLKFKGKCFASTQLGEKRARISKVQISKYLDYDINSPPSPKVGSKLEELKKNYPLWRKVGEGQEAELIGFQWATWEIWRSHESLLKYILSKLMTLDYPKYAYTTTPHLFTFRSIIGNKTKELGKIWDECLGDGAFDSPSAPFIFNKSDYLIQNIALFRGTLAQSYINNHLNPSIFLFLLNISFKDIDLNILAHAYKINIKYYYIIHDDLFVRKGFTDSPLVQSTINILEGVDGSCFIMYDPKSYKKYFIPLWKIVNESNSKLRESNKILKIGTKEEVNRCKECYMRCNSTLNKFRNCSEECKRTFCDNCVYLLAIISEKYVTCPNCDQKLTVSEILELNKLESMQGLNKLTKIPPYCIFCESTDQFYLLMNLHTASFTYLLKKLNLEEKTITDAKCSMCKECISYDLLLQINFNLTQKLAERTTDLNITREEVKWNLSQNILFIILSYLDIYTLLNRAIRICKAWRATISHPYFSYQLMKIYIRLPSDMRAEELFSEHIMNKKYVKHLSLYSRIKDCANAVLETLRDHKVVNFLGYRTDGGIMNDNSTYDMRGLFGRNNITGFPPTKNYTSKPNTKNITVTGILIVDNPTIQLESKSNRFIEDERIKHLKVPKLNLSKVESKHQHSYIINHENTNKDLENLVIIDISKHLKESLNSLFFIKRIGLSNKGFNPCSSKTLAIFVHNQPLSYEEEILTAMSDMQEIEDIDKYIEKYYKKQLIPPVLKRNILWDFLFPEEINPNGHIIFDQRFYEKERKRINNGELNLRLIAWIQFGVSSTEWEINFTQNIIGRFVTVKLIDAFGTGQDSNINIEYIHLYGTVIPSLLA